MIRRPRFAKNLAVMCFTAVLTLSACSDDDAPPASLPEKPLDEYMDTDVYPGDDFYQYANGAWLDGVTLPAGKGYYNKLEMNLDQVNKQLQQMLGDASNEKLNRYYTTAMNTQLAEQTGMQTAQPYLDMIEAIGSRADLFDVFRQLYREGFKPLFDCMVTPSYNPTLSADKINVLFFVQGGRTLDPRYYQKPDQNATIVQAYRSHLAEVFKMLGRSEQEAIQAADNVWNTEQAIARQAVSGNDSKIITQPARRAKYMPRRASGGAETGEGFTLEYLVSLVGLTEPEPQALGMDLTCEDAIALLEEGDISQLKDYLAYRVMFMLYQTLPDKYLNSFADFTTQLTGKTMTRHETTLKLLESVCPAWVGQTYTDTYLTDETKAQVTQLTRNLQDVMRKRLQQNTWMGENTKAAAIEKLDNLQIHIGKGSVRASFDNLSVGNASYTQNLINLRRFAIDYIASCAGKRTDVDSWASMTIGQQMVNAFASHPFNAICITAAILQAPVYSISQDIPELYGCIGVVIGHEITHNYDNSGCEFDKNGNRQNWWTEKDKAEFTALGNRLAGHYSTYEVKPGVTADGQRTLGEDIADLGGLHIAFEGMCNALRAEGIDPYAKVNGYSPAQRFFIAYAHLWATVYNEKTYDYLLQVDIHSVNKLRINGPLPLMDEWYKAFDIDRGRLYVAPENRIRIW